MSHKMLLAVIETDSYHNELSLEISGFNMNPRKP